MTAPRGPLSEQWLFEERLGTQVARYGMGSVLAVVDDDGERAVYEVRRHGVAIASGGDPDLDGSIAAVEGVLVAIGWLYAGGEEVAA